MKLNIIYGDNKESNTLLSDHLTIDFFQKDINHLDKVCEDAECTSIVANDLIDYFTSVEVDNLVENLLAKIRHQGKIIIGGTDINEVAKAILNKQIDLIKANVILFGIQNEAWQFRKSSITGNTLVKVLKQHGMKILKNRTNNYRYIIEAERP